MNYSAAKLRQDFLDFFQSKGHTVVASSPLVPANDSTLMFTNAGMVQFKDVFVGQEQRSYVRATTCQRCVRAGGKHNDLENVGYTARHHTFFEMLGNFSFGDYFKRKAINYAWEFLTGTLQIPAEKLWITIYTEDDEAANIWLNELKIDAERFTRCGEKDNFWAMGDTGPCGPCSEIFYDHGPGVAGGPPGSPEAEGDRYVELWNLVFMQYDRDANGKLHPLPKPSVDTGMGLERLAAVMNNVHSNYEIDLFQNLLRGILKIVAKDSTSPFKDVYAEALKQTIFSHTLHLSTSFNVIADHIRACGFLVADGVFPSNEGRGYVLRRIIRRAIRHGHKLELHEPFFFRLVDVLDEQMGDAYPLLRENKALVARVLEQEEKHFAETLEHGMRLLKQVISDLTGPRIPGDVVFKLYDTYGFPTDLTADVAREHNLQLDMAGFEKAMEAQRHRARAASHFEGELPQESPALAVQTVFTGYDGLTYESRVLALYSDGAAVESLPAGDKGRIILEKTPFYAESGGQAGDHGVLRQGDNTLFKVEDTRKTGLAYVHIGVVEAGVIRIGDKLSAEVDAQARQSTARNHSATHLLHAALRRELGEHVKQKGSLVDPGHLRFDFSHFEPVSPEQLARIEREVNSRILTNSAVQTRIMSLEEAMNSGAMALFGEKYADQVRVLSIGDFSTELCGGTHVQHAGDIGLCKILSETGVAAGVRRIEAITGIRALDWVVAADADLTEAAGLLKTERNGLKSRLLQMLAQARSAEKELERLRLQQAGRQGSDLASRAVEVKGIKVVAARLENTDAKGLRSAMDRLKSQLDSAAIVLAVVKGKKINLAAGVTSNQTKRLKAGPLVNHVASQVGGKGGGRPDMAQGGGNDPSKLDGALKSVAKWVAEQF
ncbi:MAG: alanine--tRNA ligase [Gammaproteobacteria bacterium]|nr:alanine--tRNA ligase [Gammaproteobacteria bacterium]